MKVDIACETDIVAWLALAAEVEPLFGPMVDDPDFHRVLLKNIRRGSAFCIREGDGPPGSQLLGGLLFSAHPPQYRIGWLAVTGPARRQGLGRMLVEHIFTLVKPPAEVSVIIFGEDVEGGQPARAFYESLGFHPAEAAPRGPEGGSRQVFRRWFL